MQGGGGGGIEGVRVPFLNHPTALQAIGSRIDFGFRVRVPGSGF